MKIALVSREFPPTRQAGGIATYTAKTARMLAAAGHEVHVISEAHRLAPVDQKLAPNLIVHRCPDPGWRPREAKVLRRAFDVDRALRSLGRLDVVQACEWEGEAAVFSLHPTAPLVTRLATPRRVVERLNGARPRERSRSLTVRTLERLQTRLSAKVISPSRALAEVVARDWRLDVSRIEIVPTGIDCRPVVGALPEAAADLAGRRFLLYFGRLEVRKGVQDLLDALPDVLGLHPDVLAVLAGDDLGLMSESFAEYGRRRCGPHAGRLRFFPRLPQHEVLALVARAEVVVLPSRWESVANACLEAMSLGKPLVACTGSGFAEVIDHGVEGLLVPPADPRALASTLNTLLQHPEQAASLGRAAQQRANDFDIQAMVERLLGVYRRVADLGTVGRERRTAA